MKFKGGSVCFCLVLGMFLFYFGRKKTVRNKMIVKADENEKYRAALMGNNSNNRKILLLAYARYASFSMNWVKCRFRNHNFIDVFCDRSGSSFFGDLLSAGPKAAYFFEPLCSLKVEGQSIQNVLKRDPSQSYHVEEFVHGIFNCSSSVLHQLQLGTQPFKIIRKGGLYCDKSNPRVVKTIRLHRTGLEPWIYKSDIKVRCVI